MKLYTWPELRQKKLEKKRFYNEPWPTQLKLKVLYLNVSNFLSLIDFFIFFFFFCIGLFR